MDEKKEIEKFDPHQFAQQLKDKIRLDIAEFLPPDQWEQQIENEVIVFLKERQVDEGGYHSKIVTKPSELSEIVREVMREETKKHLSGRLSRLTCWNDAELDPLIEKIIRENMEDVMKGLIGNALQNLISNLNLVS